MKRTLRSWFGMSGFGARVFGRALLLSVAALAVACAGDAGRAPAKTPLAELRKSGVTSKSDDDVGRWLLSELYDVGGSASEAKKARKHLDELEPKSMLGHLARGVDDSLHGQLARAADHFLEAVRAAKSSDDSLAPMVAWYAANRAVALRSSTHGLWRRWQGFVEEALKTPGNIGWRARSELLDLWSVEAMSAAAEDVQERTAQGFGCVKHMRLAGPFGTDSLASTLRGYPPEDPGPWPERFPRDSASRKVPHVLRDEEHGCRVEVDEEVDGGIFYAETYLELAERRSLVIAAQSALAIWIDDALVLERKFTEWGAWGRFGTAVVLAPGRHRVLVKLGEPGTSLRVMNPDGTPALAATSDDPSLPYHGGAPSVGADPNLVMRYVRNGKTKEPGSTIERILASQIAHIEGQHDVASVLLEPLIKDPTAASGPTLSLASAFAAGDPLFDKSQSEDLVRALSQRALDKDPELWSAALALLLGSAESRGLPDTVAELRQLVERFPDVAALGQALGRMYGELGWVPEQRALVKRVAERFPNDVDSLLGAVDVFDAEGNPKRADLLVQKIRELDPDTEVDLARALSRQDYDRAIAELKRLEKRRPDRKDLAQRLLDLLELSGRAPERIQRLQAAVKEEPMDGRARLSLADAHLAGGDTAALTRALAAALESGADAGPLLDAIDLVLGATELEPYRVKAEPIIAAYEASGQHMEGTAARILDYSAIWISADGSSRMLEHEIIRIQSDEAIDKFAEHPRLDGLVLHMRVIKADGRTLEPEFVSGKPTVTFPHLEVGDYIETEHIVHFAAEDGGDTYTGPRWFFREENVAYARSEFVVISPKHRRLDIETAGNVPAPKITEMAELVSRHWRVDASPAAPVEPLSAPITEFLPSVRVGWGITLDQRIAHLAQAVTPTTPIDPRIVRIAQNIVKPLPRSATRARARQLYRWVLSNVQHGEELDGRRVIVGKNGNRWQALMMLCRALDIPTTYAIAKNNLAEPPRGPMSRSELYSIPVLRVGDAKESDWLTVNDKHAPFGYVPAEARGMDAYLLTSDHPRKIKLPDTGAVDRLAYVGEANLARDGSASFTIERRFEGKFAAQLRGGLEQVAERQLRDVVESRILGSELKGARLANYEIVARDDLDAPLGIRMTGNVAQLAHTAGGGLSIPPPFMPRLSPIAALPTRQTPLLVNQALDRTITLRLRLPPGATARLPKPVRIAHASRVVTVKDRVENGVLILERAILLSAGRIQPADYAAFAEFIRRADEALNREIQIDLR